MSVTEIQMDPEDPITTVMRLLNRSLKIVRDDGSLAKVYISREWYDRELFKDYDGQITIGIAESRDERLEISGRIRRRIITFRLNVWATDKPGPFDPGRTIRRKMVDAVNRVIRENRNTPNRIRYDFVGLGYPEGDPHKAFSAAASTELAPNSSLWTELREHAGMGYDEYRRIWYSDDWRYSKEHTGAGEYPMMLFRFKFDGSEKNVLRLELEFEGYGSAPGGNGITIKVWNHETQAWENAVSGSSGSEDETLTITLNVTNEEDLSAYIDDDGYVWMLARTNYPSNGSSPAILFCDYVRLFVTVKGVSYLDIISYRDLDNVNFKPFIYRTEFLIRGWMFENIGGIF